MSAACNHCGTTIRHGNRYGCCSGCGRMFAGQSAFDRHQSVGETDMVCHDPASLVTEKGKRAGQPVYRRTTHQGFDVWALNGGPNPWAKEAD